MRKLLFTLTLLLVGFISFAQNAGNILNSRNYVYPKRPLFIPMLLDSGVFIYKTSVDSLYIRAIQVSGLALVAKSGEYSDLLNRPNLGVYVKYTDTANMLTSYAKISFLEQYLLKEDTTSLLASYARTSALNSYLLKSDTSLFVRKSSLGQYVSYSDTASMLLPYAKSSAIPTNNNQLTNGAGYLTSFTEVDPTVPSYAKSLTAFSIIKSSTDPLYKSVSYVPSWSEITSKPTFSTVATSGSYNDLSNKPAIPSAQVNSDWNATSGVSQILNKPTIKSSVTYSGTTNGSGVYSVTFPTAYSVAPNIQANIVDGTPNQFVTITVTTTGFTVTAHQRNAVNLLAVEVLLAATTTISGAKVDVLITQK